MIITEERQNFYNEIGVNTEDLKAYYINRAQCLINALSKFKDDYTEKYKEILINYIDNPARELKDVIAEYPKNKKKDYNDFGINNTEFDIYYLDKELIDFYVYGVE